jgi:D-arabinose 5-phosphate isomerase GutQ
MEKSITDEARRAFVLEADGIAKAASLIDDETIFKAVDMLAFAERIGSSGCGHSGIACRHFAHLMCCIERPARFISPSEAVHGAMGFLKKGDVMLLASRGGKTAELLPIMDICKSRGVQVISMTENLDSPLARHSDLVLTMSVTRETDAYDSQGTTSFAVMNVIFDALQAALIVKTGYRNEQFAVIHPNGAVGERLNSHPKS